MATLYITSNNTIKLQCSFLEKDLAKKVPHYQWNNNEKVWYYPYSEECISTIKQLFPNIKVEKEISKDVLVYTETERKLIQLKNLTSCDIEVPLLNATLREHQKVGVNYLLNIDCAMLADVMGVGKTLQSIVLALLRRSRNEIKKTVIICPATVKYAVWQREITKFTTEKCVVIDGNAKKRKEQYLSFLESNDIFFLIVNYESLVIDSDMLSRLPYESLIIADESVYIKNRNSKRTKAVKKLRAKYKVAISGYPIANRLPDLHSQMDWLLPDFLGSFWSFQDKYLNFLILKKRHDEETKLTGKNCKCKKCGKWSPEQKYASMYTCKCAEPEWNEQEFKKLIGYKNLDELKFKLEPYYIRRLKKDVLKDLPDKIYEQREVSLSGELLKAYNNMKEDMHVLIRNMSDSEVTAKAATIMTQMLRLSQLTCGFISDKNLEQPVFYKENPKVDALDDIVDEVLGNDDKIVIWTRFRPFMFYLYKRYSEGYKYAGETKKHDVAYLCGQMQAKIKDDNIYRFQNDPNCKMMIGTVQAVGIGITLHAANVEVFTDLSFLSPSTVEQATDRLHRLGQKKTVVVIDTIAKNTVDEHWIKILENKQQVSNMIFDDDGIVRINTKNNLLKLLE